MTEPELTPTSAAEWPRNVAKTVTLPSGGVAKLKAPDTFALIRQGKVPRSVVAVIAKQHNKQAITPAEAMTLIEFLIAASFVTPEVAMTRKTGALCVRDLSAEDKAAVITEMGLVTP
jgi:hypothetical protein